jgi:hypothetical protein
VALSKHVTHYGPGSGFSYCNMTTPSRGFPLSEDAMSSYVGLSPRKHKRYPQYDYLILCRIRGPSIDASYQVSVHLAKWFQRRTFLKIGQSEKQIAFGGHVCYWIGTK